MTVRNLPEWAKPGTRVIIHATPGGGNSGEVTEATIVRTDETTAWVASPTWAKGHERTFIPRRNSWQPTAAASTAQLEEKGGVNHGFNSSRLLCPADSDLGRSLLQKARWKKSLVAAQGAAEAFSRRPTKQSAAALQAVLTEYLEVVP